MQYHAFLSYSHGADGQLARALQSGLQRLAKPWFRRPIIKIFRDQTSLSANPGLWSELEKSLANCSYFILLASRAAAQSPWVRREVAWWTANRNVQSFFIVVTDGEVRWLPDAADFEWSSTTALPKALKGLFTEEPLYVDLTWAKGKDDLSLRHSQFRAAVLDLAAPLHGKPKDELDSEDIRQNRRFRAVAWTAVSVIALLLVAASIAAWIAVQNADEAVRQSITAVSRQHAVGAQLSVRDGVLGSAITAALKAIRTEDTPEARAALFAALEAAWDIHAVLRLHQSPVLAIAFRDDDNELLTWSDDSTLVRWDVVERRPSRAPFRGERLDAQSAAFSPDTKLLAIGERNGTTTLRDVETMQVRATFRERDLTDVTALAFDPEGTLLAAGYGTGQIVLWNVSSGTRAPIRLEESDRLLHKAFVSGLWFSDGTRYLAAANQHPSASIGVWQLPSGKLLTGWNPSTSFWVNTKVAFVSSTDDTMGGTYMFVADSEGTVHVGRETRGYDVPFQSLRSTTHHQGAVSAIAAAPRALATGGADGRVSIFPNVADGRSVTPVGWTNARVSTLAFGTRFVAAGAADGTVTLFYAQPSRPRPLDDVFFNTRVARRSPDGKWMVRPVARLGVIEERFALTHAASGRVIPELVHGSVSFSADNRWMLSSNEDWFALWDLSDEHSLSKPLMKREANRASLSRSGRFLVTETLRTKGEVRVIDLAAQPFKEHVLSQNVFGRFRGFSPDETLALTTTGRELHLWDVARGAEIGSPIELEPLSDDDDDDDTYQIAFSPDGRWIVAGRSLGTSALYPTQVGANQPAFPVKRFKQARFSLDGEWVAISLPGQVDGVWNTKTLTPLFQTDGKRPGSWDFTKDGRWVFGTTLDGQLQVWDLRQAKPQPTTISTNIVQQVELSPDSRWLLSPDTDRDRTAIWDLATLNQHQLPMALSRPHAFSPHGDLVAADNGGPIVLINVSTGTPVARLEGHSKRLHAAAFSPDGRVLASIDANGSLILWDPTTTRRLSETLVGTGEDEDSINRLEFDADGLALLVSGGRVPAHPSTWIDDMCRRIDPGLSEPEWQKLVGSVPYPWTCASVRGITRDDIR